MIKAFYCIFFLNCYFYSCVHFFIATFFGSGNIIPDKINIYINKLPFSYNQHLLYMCINERKIHSFSETKQTIRRFLLYFLEESDYIKKIFVFALFSDNCVIDLISFYCTIRLIEIK